MLHLITSFFIYQVIYLLIDWYLILAGSIFHSRSMSGVASRIKSDLGPINRSIVLNLTFSISQRRLGQLYGLLQTGPLNIVSSNQFERCSLYSLGAVSHKLGIKNKLTLNWQREFLESFISTSDGPEICLAHKL